MRDRGPRHAQDVEGEMRAAAEIEAPDVCWRYAMTGMSI